MFAVESSTDLDSWVDCINEVIREDRMRSKKSIKKNTLAEAILTEQPTDAMGHAPHVGTLMGTLPCQNLTDRAICYFSPRLGVYNIAINHTDLSKALNLTGTYTLDVTPRGMSIISSTTETEIIKWHYKHVKYYAKSTKNVIVLEMGKRSPTGEGKFAFQTTVAKELFSMIHRNIKNIKIAHDKKAKEDLTKEIDRIKETKKKKEESRTRHTLRPKSLSYDLDTDTNSHLVSRTLPKQPSLDPFTSVSTIGTVAEEDLIQLEGFTIDIPDSMEDFYPNNMESFERNLPNRNRLSMGALIDQKLELDSLKPLTDTVYQDPATVKKPRVEMDEYVEMNLGTKIPSEPGQQDRFEDSFTDATSPPRSASGDPFANVTDPFSSSTRGSFYNTEDDIFHHFEQIPSPNKTSTPNNIINHHNSTPRHIPSYSRTGDPFKSDPPQPRQRKPSVKKNIQSEPVYTNVSEALKGLKDIQLDTQNKGEDPPVPKPRTLKRGATKQQLDEMWGDIEADFKMP